MAALEMRRAVAQGETSLTHRLGGPVDIRIGLNSGEAVVKRVTSGSFTGYEANGEVVHVAARMEQIARENTILLTADTARLVAAHFHLRALPPQDVKGLANPLEVFELLGERAGAAPPRRFDPGPFVSRSSETAAIAEAWAAAAAGCGQVVLIRGEAGLGKSRLLGETLLRRPDGQGVTGGSILGATVGLGAAAGIAYAQGRPLRPRGYQLAAELVASGLDLETPESGTVEPESLKARLSAMEAAALFAPLAVVLGLTVTEPEWAALTPSQRRDRMQGAICQVVECLAARRPLVMVAEDLHWVDPESLEVLDRVIARLSALPILLVVTCRPEWHSHWRAAPWLRELQLSPLPEKSLRCLLAARLEGPHAYTLAQAVAHRAGGNPLFAELMLSALADAGGLIDLGSHFHILREVSPDQLPPTIRGLLSERVDRLPALEKRVLRAASVIGPRNSMTLLSRVSECKVETLRAVATRLQGAGFLDVLAGPELTLVFRHELMRETVYADLLLRTRREMHGRVVEALQGLEDEQRHSLVEDLAEHARHASRWTEAARYAWLAAQKALERDAHVEAAYFLRSAIASVEHWPAGSERAGFALRLHLAIRDPLFRLGRIDELAEHLEQAAALIDETTDWRLRGLFHVQLSHVSSLRGESEAALAECAKALLLARRHGDAALAARAQFQEGLERHLRWEFEAAVATLDAAWNYVSVNPDDTSYGLQRGFDAAALSYVVRALAELGRFAEADDAIARLLEVAAPRGRAFDSFFACIAAGHLQEARDAPLEARPWFEQAETWCRSGDMPLLGLVAVSHLGLVMIRAGDLAGGLAKLQAAHSQIDTMGFRHQLAYCLASLAEGYLLDRDLVAARSAAEQAIRVAAVQYDAGARIQALLVLAECQQVEAGDDLDAGAGLRAEALAIAERLHLRPAEARCRRRLAIIA
jgi:tetratricopeptide (TPR) repeat protein